MADNICKAAIYVRLSHEDEEKKTSESESIQNQKEFLLRFALENKLNVVSIYIDDGYTGTNFDRPGFKNLIDAIKNKKINTVITKDLSRLGRDYIETGEVLEKYFPKNNIRYIAVNDNMDSSTDQDNLMLPFKLVFNDYYARDISQKVRSTLDTKRKHGKFIGAFAPYGYKKDPCDKNHLVIDENVAPIVNRIFELFLFGDGEGIGFGATKISNILNYEAVLCPAAYKKLQNKSYNNMRSTYYLWTPEEIISILKNPTYAGNLTQNKYEKINYKLKNLKAISPNKWITINNTHEAIIESSVFEEVQQLIKSKAYTNYSPKRQHMLSGILYCGDCGSKMTYIKTLKGTSYCICAANKRYHVCSRHSINEEELVKCIKKDLLIIFKKNLVIEELIKKLMKKGIKSNCKNTEKTEIIKLQNRAKEIKIFIKRLLEDKYLGKISEDLFDELAKDYNIEQENITNNLIRLTEIAKNKEENYDSIKKQMDELLQLKNLDRIMISKLIKKIEIFEDNCIKIYYSFKLEN